MSEQTIVAPEAAPSLVVSPESPLPESTPAEPPKEGAPDTPAEQPGESDDADKKPKQKASERIGEIYGRMKQAERERDLATAELARLRQPMVDPEKWDQLSYDQQQALQMRHAVRQERAAEVAESARARDAEAQNHRAVMFQERLGEFVARVPEAKVIVSDPTLPVTDIGARFISESEKGPEVAYWLHQNRQDALRIAALEPVAQAFELGRIEARISSAPTARKVSNAPAPTPKVSGGAGTGAKDPNTMSEAEYSEWYRARNRR